MFRPATRIAVNFTAAVFVSAHVAACAFLFATGRASADDGSACYSIVSGDHRAYCLAKARNDPAMCYSIIDGSMRAQCLAEVRREASH